MYALMDRLARFFALLGGAVLTFLILQTCLSILGRSINTILYSDLVQSAFPGLATALLATGVGSINGAFELVEAGMAFVVFAFLPLCQLNGAHASVDVFTSALPPGMKWLLRMVIDTVFAIAILIIAWQLFQGLVSKQRSGQTTLILQFPVWWAYALSLMAAIAWAIIGVYVAVMRALELVTAQQMLPAELEPDH